MTYPVGPYGEATWGGYWRPATQVISQSNSTLRVGMTAQSRNYNELIIGWDQPSDIYDGIALVRNTYGPPLTITDGVTVFSFTQPEMATPQPPPGQINPFVDIGLTGGVFYSYSLFLHLVAATPMWQRVGAITAFVAFDYRTGDDLFEMLPLFYQQDDQQLYEPSQIPPLPQYVGQGPLQRFLNLVGYSYDSIRTEMTNGLEIFNAEKLRADAIFPASLTYGFPFEPFIGWRQQRLLWKNWAYILKTKGTKLGIEAFASALTGYGATAFLSKNLFLDANQSEALATVGGWTASGITITRDQGFAQATPVGPTPFGTTVANFKVVCKSGGPQDNTFHNTALTTNKTVRNTGIPVTAGKVYALSFGAEAGTTQRNVMARIAWHDATGAHIVDSDGTPLAEAISTSSPSWLLVGEPVRPFVIATAPAGAVYADPVVVIKAAASLEVHYVTAFQFEVVADMSSLPTFYEIAREVYISLEADRVNLSPNPGLENDSEDWITDGGNCTVQRNTDFSYQGETSLLVTSIAAGDFGIAHTVFDVNFSEHDLYYFSVYIRQNPADVFAGVRAIASMRWYSDPTIQNSGTLIATQPGITPIDVGISGWSSAPVSVTAQAPAGARSAQGVITVTNGPPANLRVYIDAALFEKNGGPGGYFDGDTDPSSGEYLWEGTAGNSASHHYSGKPLRDARLQALLPDFLPAFTSWKVLYAQPSS